MNIGTISRAMLVTVFCLAGLCRAEEYVVPTVVVGDVFGTFRVDTAVKEFPNLDAFRTGRPSSVPVRTVLPNGDTVESIVFTNTLTTSLVAYHLPMHVETSGQGGFRVVSVDAGVSRTDGPPFSPGLMDMGGLNVPVYYDEPGPAPLQHHSIQDRAGWTLTFVYDPVDAEMIFGVERAGYLAVALTRVKNKFEELMAGCVGNIIMEVRFVGGLPPNFVMLTESQVFGGGAFSSIKHFLQGQAAADSEDDDLTVYTDCLPATSLPIIINNTTGATRNVAAITTHRAIFQQLRVAVPPPPCQCDAIVRVNVVDYMFDFSVNRGLRPSHQPFEAVLSHEIIHGLGFVSLADAGEAPLDHSPPFGPYVWDIFRLPLSSFPSNCNAPQTHPRELRTSFSAANPAWSTGIGVQAKLASWGYVTDSQGTVAPGQDPDMAQGSHWRNKLRAGATKIIGIMDPYTTNLISDAMRHYYLRNDVAALDMMAYNVEPQPIPLASTNPTLVSPSHQSAVASTTPMFSWEEDGQSFRWNLFLYNNANTDVDIPTLSFEDIQGTSFSIPAASALQPGHVYAWEVSGEDTSGFNLSEIRTFIVHCTADFDFNGFVDPDDLFAFLDAWFAPSFIADVTNDGLVDADVLFFFLDAWFAGC